MIETKIYKSEKVKQGGSAIKSLHSSYLQISIH